MDHTEEQDSPQDAVAFMQVAVPTLAIAAGAIILLLAYLLVSTLDYADALTAEAMRKEKRAEVVIDEVIAIEEERQQLHPPLPFSATVTQPNAEGELRTRHYVPSGK